MVCAAQGHANNSTFSTGLGIWKGNRRSELWHEKVFPSNTWITEGSKKGAQEWRFLNKAAAIECYRYKSITGRDVSSLGLAIHPGKRLDWIRASPDGLLGWFPGGGVQRRKAGDNAFHGKLFHFITCLRYKVKWRLLGINITWNLQEFPSVGEGGRSQIIEADINTQTNRTCDSRQIEYGRGKLSCYAGR